MFSVNLESIAFMKVKIIVYQGEPYIIGGRSSILPTDWHVLILCIIFHLENLYFKLKWYVEYGIVLLNLFSQWNLCQYITFYRNHNFV